MAEVVLSEKLLGGLAGWDVIKQARAIVAEDRVLSSSWKPPLLRGVVQAGTTSYRAGLVIRRENDAENLCTCRQSREWGTLCAHSVAVGLHALKPAHADAPTASPFASATGATLTANSAKAPLSSHSGSPRRTPPRESRRLRRANDATAAESLEILVVFPPSLAEALNRDRATVFFEGRWRRGTAPLASLPLDQPFVLDPPDTRLLDAAELLAGGDTPAMLQLTAADFGMLLEALAGHPRIAFGKTRPVSVRLDPWPAPLRATLHSTGEILLQLKPLPRPPAVIPGQRLWVLDDDLVCPLGLPASCVPALSGPLKVPRSQVPDFLTSVLPVLRQNPAFEADFTPADFELTPAKPVFHLHLVGGLAQLTAHLQCAYGPRILTLASTATNESVWSADPANPRRYTTRDPAAEKEALSRLVRHGFSGPDSQGRWTLNGQNLVLTFFAREYPRLEREWKVTLEERLARSTRQNLERIEPRFAVTPSGEQWFDLQVSYATTGGERIPATEIQRLLRGGQNFTRLRNGRFAVLDTGAVEELEEILVDCSPEQHAGGYRMHQAQAGFLDSTLRQQGWEPVVPAAWRERALQQTGDRALTCPPLGELDAVLRPYQKQGVAWLAFLRRHGFGGVLADEMGLGKTLQTLAHLATARCDTDGGRAPHLVVCPTSLVSNWTAEVARFTPQLRVVAIHGTNRDPLFARLPDSDLVVTSYALLRRDFERYRGIEFDTVILDEAQHIKNRQTQNAQSVKAIRSRHRLILTGTPLENSVLDLWSLFDFLMPGYLGAAQDFRERYEVPIVREKDAATQARLARRVRPFLLRRLKRDVAPELPPRIDQVVWCDLSEEQAAVYAQLLDATRRDVTAAVGAQGLARSRMMVLTALLRLRQVCCDLRLLEAPATLEPAARMEGPAAAGSSPASAAPRDRRPPTEFTAGAPGVSALPASGKLDAFSELLEEIVDGGHRVLVFSQFTRMLGLLKERLAAEDIAFCYLDGATRDRAAEVARFQSGVGAPVFLISLKAGGVGLNLTAADTVIHFDPWWNPAVEDQASDRAHRLGQTRVVTSYKLIARGTVEEKILALQRRKRDIIQDLISGEDQLTENLGWDEIQELLA